MPRTARAALGGVMYHVLNRGNGRRRVFRKPGDYLAFTNLLVAGQERAAVEVFAFCLMPNHWHLLIRPKRDGDLAAYMSWVTNTHVKRYRVHYPSTSGHLYQGRYKSFAVQETGYFVTLARYIEANPVRARLVPRAEAWPWSSLGCQGQLGRRLLSPWPVDRPASWRALVNEPVPAAQRAQVAESLKRGSPLGDAAWVKRMAEKLGVEYTLRPRGRPRKAAAEEPA